MTYQDEFLKAKMDLQNAEFNLKIARENYYKVTSQKGIKNMIDSLYPVPEVLANKIKK